LTFSLWIEGKKIVYEDLFLRRRGHKYFRREFYIKNDLQGISNRRQKRRFDREIFFLAIRRVKRNRQQSTWRLLSEKWISLEKHFGRRMSFPQQLLLQRDSTTTENLQNALVHEEVCKITAMHN
jgi:hypothetical protein